MTPFVEEEAMATMLMSMAAENLTPPSVHYDPYLMHGGGMGAMMMSMATAAQGLDSTKKIEFSFDLKNCQNFFILLTCTNY